MKTLLTPIILSALLCGCRLYTVTQGDGYIHSESGNFFCLNNAGDCVEQYDVPTTETLIAQPSEETAFRRWKNCNYASLTSCETNISQAAIDNDLEWTITAVFDKKKPDIQPAQYTYNALGQRITKTVDGVTTVFQYDLDGKLIAELDASGHPLRQHVYLEGAPIAMLERKTQESNTAVYYVHTDHLATPDLITNQQGRVVADFENTPFGVPHINYSEIDYHLGFPGQYYDEENGLHYNYHRNYDAHTGRYMQSDPIGLKGGLNTYTYVHGNPLSNRDPFGLRGMNSGYPYSGNAPIPTVGVTGCIGTVCASGDIGGNSTELSIGLPELGGNIYICVPQPERQKDAQSGCMKSEVMQTRRGVRRSSGASSSSPDATFSANLGKFVGFSTGEGKTCIKVGVGLSLPISVSKSNGRL